MLLNFNIPQRLSIIPNIQTILLMFTQHIKLHSLPQRIYSHSLQISSLSCLSAQLNLEVLSSARKLNRNALFIF